jgi:hypothetical protein
MLGRFDKAGDDGLIVPRVLVDRPPGPGGALDRGGLRVLVAALRRAGDTHAAADP